MTVFVDSNIPMYLVGADPTHKEGAQRRLDALVTERARLVTDVEVLQEILHRYSAIDRLDAVQPAFDVLLAVVDEVYPVALAEVEAAKQVLLGGAGISARDAFHVAVMRAHGIVRILTFDSGFDRLPDLERVA